MAWRVAIGAAAVIVLLVVVVSVFRRVGGWLRTRLERLLGQYFEYLSIFSALALAVLALVTFAYFLVPLGFWLAAVVGVVAVVALLVAMP